MSVFIFRSTCLDFKESPLNLSAQEIFSPNSRINVLLLLFPLLARQVFSFRMYANAVHFVYINAEQRNI